MLEKTVCKCVHTYSFLRPDINVCISGSVGKCISFAELLHLYCGGAGVESFGGWRLE